MKRLDLMAGWSFVQVAKAAYSRAGYKKWIPTPVRRVPWASDVDETADLMFKQLYTYPDSLKSRSGISPF
jgi:hypothetical protein